MAKTFTLGFGAKNDSALAFENGKKDEKGQDELFELEEGSSGVPGE